MVRHRWELDMTSAQNKPLRIQIPLVRTPAILICGKEEVRVHIIDQSASDFDVSVPSGIEIQPDKTYVLKTTEGVYETRVVSCEYVSDGQNLGLTWIRDLPTSGEQSPHVAPWQEYLQVSESSSIPGGLTARIAIAAVAGSLICVLAQYGLHYLPTKKSPDSNKYLQDLTEIVAKEVAMAQQVAADANTIPKEEKPSGGKKVHSQDVVSDQLARQQLRFSAEFLYRLQLSAEQCQRIRNILHRNSSDLAAAEEEIQLILTPEQRRRWQTLAPDEPH
jgi:hypothetical protein